IRASAVFAATAKPHARRDPVALVLYQRSAQLAADSRGPIGSRVDIGALSRMMRSRCRLPSQPPRVVFAAKTTVIVKSKPSVPVAFQSQAKRAPCPGPASSAYVQVFGRRR